VGQFHWDPATYLELMDREVPGYRPFQDAVAAATLRGRPNPVTRVLDLGSGTGETARRVLALHTGATLSGVDASDDMLEAARRVLPPERAVFHRGRLEDPLPDPGPFDLAISALAVHHLVADDKRRLFGRVFDVVRPGGRFVLGDVVTVDADDAAAGLEASVPVDGDEDRPDSVADQLAWMRDVGFSAEVVWRVGDLAVMVADR